MNFSVTTTEKSGILQACERYTSLGVAGITGDTALLAEFTNYVNEESRKAWHIIFDAYGGWQYDDSQQTDLPAAVDTLTADQTSYALPSEALTVRGVEIKNTGGVWTQLGAVTEEQIRERQPMGEFFKTSSIPQFYQLVGDSVRIYPASNYTQASSFKVFFDRGSVAFTTTDTTDAPGFASEYHDIIPIGASLTWQEVKHPNDATTIMLRNKYEERKASLRDFYQRRWMDKNPARIRVRDAMAQYM